MLGLFAAVALTLSPAVHADWMTSVGRNTQTGERTSFSARLTGEDESTMAIVCRSGSLSVTYDTKLEMGWDLAELDAMSSKLLVSADGGAVVAFPAHSASVTIGEVQEVQLVLDAEEALQLAHALMGATNGSGVSFSLNDTEMNGATYSGGVAAEPIGWVLDECGVGGKSKPQSPR